MRIANFTVQSKSEHYLEKTSISSEKLNIWTDEKSASEAKETPSVIVDITMSDTDKRTASGNRVSTDTKENSSKDDILDAKLRLIESLVYALTGKRIKLKQPSLDPQEQSSDISGGAVSAVSSGAAGWGVSYDRVESYEEKEQIAYSSSGSVLTADGRSISFNLDFTMSRSFYEQNSVSFRLGDAARMDPLVIAYAGKGPQLSNEKVAFDLNGDGNSEKISFAVNGSGFLALDRNGDGAINDGTELFGTKSGNGFADLRAYDEDRNGWIDEADPVFGNLSILTMDEDGNRTMFSLGDAGVGAIYLQETNTPFEFTDGQNSDGMMSASSIFLRENGTAGTIHHVDLTV